MRNLPTQVLILGALLLAGLVLRVIDPDPVARLRLLVFDTYQRLSPRVADPAYPVRIVDVDEASLGKIGQWPWPRTRLAEIVARLVRDGARSITLDLILAEPDRLSPEAFARTFATTPALADLAARAASLPSNDERLGQAIAGAPVVVGFVAQDTTTATPGTAKVSFAFAGDDPAQFAPAFAGSIMSLPVLVAPAAGAGGVNWLPSHDQIVRRVPLLFTIGGKLYPSLSLETLRVGQAEKTVLIKASGGSGVLAFGHKTGIDSVRVGAAMLQTDANGEMWLRASRSNAKRYIPAHTVLDGSHDPADIAGRHILIGASATGLLDLRATPLEASVPGVEIHAQALEQMLSGDYLVRPAYATGLEIVFLLLAGLALGWLIRRVGPVGAALAGAGAVLVIVITSWLAYSNGGLLLDPVYPAIALLILYIGGSLYSYIKSEADRSRVRSAFSHYVAPPLVEELVLNHDKLRLGGEMREVTILFADVRGFSKLSEGMKAEELIRFVNALFTPLSDIILEERGTIDKFMGDAVMAFWNAPVRDAAHAGNACRAALRMMDALKALNARWAEEAAAKGESATPVRIGIGLNTGNCCVGNVGSPQRFDYSLLGDPVNIASRLEEATKTYRMPIVVGERTAEAARGFAFIEIDTVALRGKSRPERIYALLGDESFATSPRFLGLARMHQELMGAIARNDLLAAESKLEAIKTQDWPEIAGLIEHIGARIAARAA